MFKKKKTVKEQAKESKRGISKSQRELEREKNALDRQERQVITDIKKAAKDGNNSGAKILAKQLVQIRAQKQKLLTMKATLGGIGLQATTMVATATMSTAMQNATKVMGSVNSQMDSTKFQKTIMEFGKQSEMMSMREEMIQDSLIDAFDEEDAEEEEEAVMSQVLAEIGLDLDAQMNYAPSTKIGVDVGVEQSVKTAKKDPTLESLGL